MMSSAPSPLKKESLRSPTSWLLLRDVEMTRDHITIQRLSGIGTFFKGTQMIS